MLDHARSVRPETPLVRCDLARLPFERQAFAGVWASRAHQHLRAADLPLALAELHRIVKPEGLVTLTVFTRAGVEHSPHGVLEEISSPGSGDDFPGRLFTWWDPHRLTEVIEHAAFSVQDLDVGTSDDHGIAPVRITAIRRMALPDHIGADMRLLCCGINPSVHAARAGVGYVSPSNRFWPALERAGLCDVPRDPRRLLRVHGIGMTDLVKRPTPRASDVHPDEYADSFARLAELCRWLKPRALVVLTLGGWRTATGDRRATVGWQSTTVGPTPVYVMPSTSGLNAHTNVGQLADHLAAAAAGP